MSEFSELVTTLPFPTQNGHTDSDNVFGILAWMQPAASAVPAYWSKRRDAFLRTFFHQSDPVKFTVATFIDKLTGIPILIQPRDRSVKRHLSQAALMQEALAEQSGLFSGFEQELEKFAEDWLTTDNGGFFAIMGDGPAGGPIIGPATGVYHLDSLYCTRTGNAQYPVVYEHEDGEHYKFHYTRVIYMSRLPSAQRNLYGVGVCPLSACLDAARELQDIIIHSQESYGSRPARRALYARKGMTIEQLKGAVQLADEKMDAAGLTRFAKTLLAAPKNPNSELILETLDLTNPPDGANRMDVTMIDIAFMAAAFGMSMMDLAFVFGRSQTGQNAEAQDRKGWGKGVSKLMSRLIAQLNQKFLPAHLEAVADTVDDAQDELQAKIRAQRATARSSDLTAGITTVRAERVRMLRQQEIDQEEFEDMELLDGRLADGTDVFALYFTVDAIIAPLLDLGVEDPTVLTGNDPQTMLDAIHEKVRECWRRIDTATTSGVSRKVRQALAALEKLRSMYQAELDAQTMAEAEAMLTNQAVGPDTQGVVADAPVNAPESGDSQAVSDSVRAETV